MENIILQIKKNKKIKKILIIDNLSFFSKINENEINDLQIEINKISTEIKLYIISNNIHQNCENIFINPDKINEVNNYFYENNIIFDIIFDMNLNDYICQLSTFSLLFSKCIFFYIIHTQTKKNHILTYNINKFTNQIYKEEDYITIYK